MTHTTPPAHRYATTHAPTEHTVAPSDINAGMTPVVVAGVAAFKVWVSRDSDRTDVAEWPLVNKSDAVALYESITELMPTYVGTTAAAMDILEAGLQRTIARLFP